MTNPKATPETLESDVLANALEKSDWSGVSIGNKLLIVAAIGALRSTAPQVGESRHFAELMSGPTEEYRSEMWRSKAFDLARKCDALEAAALSAPAERLTGEAVWPLECPAPLVEEIAEIIFANKGTGTIAAVVANAIYKTVRAAVPTRTAVAIGDDETDWRKIAPELDTVYAELCSRLKGSDVDGLMEYIARVFRQKLAALATPALTAGDGEGEDCADHPSYRHGQH